MAKISDEFWSCPAESESGKTIIVTGRDNVEKARESGKYIYRVTVIWKYEGKPDGMPKESDAEMMEKATDGFLAVTKKDSAAILTGIYTGDGERDWVFYTRSLHIFQNILNRALEPLPLLPIEVEAAEDPLWEEYAEMRDATYIPPEE